MFQSLPVAAADPLLGLVSAYRADPSENKVDLGVGVYKDEFGNTPVLDAVREAEQWLLAAQTSKCYLGPVGNEGFNAATAALVLGAGHRALREGRTRIVQTPGGCGALRVGAELVRTARESAIVHVSAPTWMNHRPLLANAHVALDHYPYYDVANSALSFDSMLGYLDRLPRGDVVLVHGSCHNPTGADLSQSQWQAVCEVMAKRALVPFVDLAYQGLGEGLDEDAYGVRLLARELPEVLIAVSCSKNFGLYRERVGALLIVGEAPEQAVTAAANVCRIARGMYSMPPDHGAAVVARILEDSDLSARWREELAMMRERVVRLRRMLADALSQCCPRRDFSPIVQQRGMFSLLSLPDGAVDRLRHDKHIYMAPDGRINISGMPEQRVEYVASSIAAAFARA